MILTCQKKYIIRFWGLIYHAIKYYINLFRVSLNIYWNFQDNAIDFCLPIKLEYCDQKKKWNIHWNNKKKNQDKFAIPHID